MNTPPTELENNMATSTDTRIICSEAPVTLVIASWGIYPLTTCCKAFAKGWADGGVVCKKCFEMIDDAFGDCWNLDEDRGWSTYKYLVAGEVLAEQLATGGRTDPREADRKADEVVAYARQKAADTIAQGI